jgi:hypothetical protein
MRVEMDTFNKYGVSLTGGGIAILMPPRDVISKKDALMFAAWLVALAGGETEFKKALDAVEAI